MIDAAIDASPDAADASLGATIAAGGSRTCTIHGDGSLWCWGVTSSQPVRVGTDNDWTAIQLGDQHRCGIRAGTLWCWGRGAGGRLGTGDEMDRAAPTQVGTENNWSRIATGFAHTCAVRAGTLWCWGTNTYGAVGDGTTTSPVTAPVQVGVDTDWTAVAAGESMTCGLRGTGTLWCWGDGTNGRTGHGDEQVTTTPTQVGMVTDWKSLSAAIQQACAQRADGSTWCWGRGQFATALIPTVVSTDPTWSSLASGYGACILRGAGELACKGQVSRFTGPGDGTYTFAQTFVTVGAGQTWGRVVADANHACAIRADGSVWCWGSSSVGQLGNGADARHTTFVRVGTASNWTGITMSLFSGVTCGLRGTSLLCWGGGGDLMGIGIDEPRQTPTDVVTGTNYAQVASGLAHTCGRKTDGTLWCWGSNGTGVLGTGGQNSNVPVQVGSATDWTAVDVDQQSCGIRAGTLWCWGPNFYGILGDGTTTTRTTPTQVGTATDWTSVTASNVNTCGIRGGVLYCWGYDIGSLPMQQDAATDWLSVSTKSSKICALKTDHTRWCKYTSTPMVRADNFNDWIESSDTCGVRANGSLWCNTAQVGTDLDWAHVVNDAFDTCAIKQSGELWCMGEGNAGELGLDDAWALEPVTVL